MKRVSNCEEPIVVVPPVLEPVEVEVALVGVAPEIRDVPVVEVLPDLYRIPSMPLSFEYSRDCIVFGTLKSASILHQVASFLEIYKLL